MCSVGGMALHGEGDGGRRTELAMFAPALPAPVGLADGDGDAAPPRAVVIPAPGEDGLLETFDGRKHRIADAAALAAAASWADCGGTRAACSPAPQADTASCSRASP